jgi:hypothetical protein
VSARILVPLLIAALSLTGCSSHVAYRDNVVRAGVGAFVALSVADAMITDNLLDDPGKAEQNPILGEDPDLGALLLLKLAGGLVVAGVTEVSCIWSSEYQCRMNARGIWGAASLISIYPVVHNASQ